MKANAPGQVLGQALSSYSGSGEGRVVLLVGLGYYDPSLVVGPDGNITLQRGAASTTILADTSSIAEVLNQQGSGGLLQLQANGTDRLLVKNDGSIALNTFVAAPDLPVSQYSLR